MRCFGGVVPAAACSTSTSTKLRLLLFSTVLVACAPVPGRYAAVYSKGGFEGPRQITVVGDSNALDQLEAKLGARGFRVSRNVPGVFTSLKGRYVLKLEGGCWRRALGLGDLKAEVFDVETNERLFVAKLVNNDWCPDVFIDDVVTAIEKGWSRAAPPVAEAGQSPGH